MPPTSPTPPVGVGAERRPHLSAADAIVRLLSPKTVLATGVARAALVDELRDRGIEVHEFDEVDRVTADVGAADRAPAATYDLAVCVGAPGHAADDRVVAALSAGDAVLLTVAGPTGAETTGTADHHADWVGAFARHGLFRDVDHDAGYLASDAVVLRRSQAGPAAVVERYERELLEVRARAAADIAELEAAGQQLHKEVLRTRDLAFGRQAELASALARVELLESTLARYDNVEQRLHEVLNSRSWRVTQTIGLPVRLLRQRR